jgi:hypothetical protein
VIFTAMLARHKVQSAYSATAARHRAFVTRVFGVFHVKGGMSPVGRVMRRALGARFYQTMLHVQLALAAVTRNNLQTHGGARRIGQQRHRTIPSRTSVRQIERLQSWRTRVVAPWDTMPQRAYRLAPQIAGRGHVERNVLPPKVAMTVIRERVQVTSQPVLSPRIETSPQPAARSASTIAVPHGIDKKSFSLPVQELSRITDHVIQQLDRRILSYRERSGRM